MAIGNIADVDIRWNGPEVQRQIERSIGKGLATAAAFLASRVKELLSVPAPRRRVRSRAGVLYYVATTPATPGAPPRKLSGRLRASIAWEAAADGKSARVGTNVIYAHRHEVGLHPFLVPALVRHREAIARIVTGGPS